MRHFLSIVVSTLAAGLLFSCGKPADRVEITETRDVTSAAPVSGHPAVAAPPSDEVRRDYTWTVPEGWTQLSPTAMRIANFTVGQDKQTECYVTILKGAGGGTEMNINRWHGQMGMESEPLSAEAIEQLPKISMLGKQVPLAEVPGTYQGMTGEAKSGYMLLGAVSELGSESVFVKMTGPESTVRGEREKFIAFCGSLQ